MTTAEDECIINYTVVSSIVSSSRPAGGVRTIALDRNNDVWVGGTVVKQSNGTHQKLSGITALPVLNTTFIGPSRAGGYGGFIDANNVLWSARGGPSGTSFHLLRVDLSSAFSTTWGADLGAVSGDYGLAIDPCTGNIWHTALRGNKVFVRNPAGTVIQNTSGYSEMNPSGTPYTAQGVAVDERGNVWIAHAIGAGGSNPTSGANTIGHINTAGAPVGAGVVNLPSPPVTGHGPTGMAIDSNGKVWVSCYNSSKAIRINPALSGGLGAADLVVDLNAAGGALASPYNYSDMTGFINLGVTTPSGVWDFVHQACDGNYDWGRLDWSVCAGTQIKVQVRAANKVTDLPTKAWRTVVKGVSFCGNKVTGRYLEVRVTLLRGTANSCNLSTACLQSLTIECCEPYHMDCGYGPKKALWVESPINLCNPTPFTTNLAATIEQPDGLPIQATFSVNGVLFLTTNLPGGLPPTSAVVDFLHTYQPGSNLVELVITDSLGDPLTYQTTVGIGDTAPPEWITVSSGMTNAFLGQVPLFQPILVDACAALGEILVTQDINPGTIVTQGTYMITLVASDPSTNRATNTVAFTVGPVLRITNPKDYERFLTNTAAPVIVQIATNVTDVVRVNYYLETNLVASSTNAPFGVALTNVAAGVYALSAQAVSATGLTSHSPPVVMAFSESGRVSITFSSTTKGILLEWLSGWTLQSAPDVLGPWIDTPGATNPYNVGTFQQQEFFRLRQ